MREGLVEGIGGEGAGDAVLHFPSTDYNSITYRSVWPNVGFGSDLAVLAYYDGPSDG